MRLFTARRTNLVEILTDVEFLGTTLVIARNSENVSPLPATDLEEGSVRQIAFWCSSVVSPERDSDFSCAMVRWTPSDRVAVADHTGCLALLRHLRCESEAAG